MLMVVGMGEIILEFSIEEENNVSSNKSRDLFVRQERLMIGDHFGQESLFSEY